MKKIHEIPDFFERLFDTKPFSVVFSIVCAILIWFTISVTAYKTTHVTLYNVPVVPDLTGTLAEANDLSVVSCDVEKVTVEVEGNRSQIGNLKEEDLVAYLQIGNISTTGEFNFDIAVKSDTTNISFNAVRISPAQATVRLDKIETRSYDVTASFPNVKVSAGHVLKQDEVTCEPSVIEITGPSAQLDEIAEAEIYTDKSVEIDSLYSLYASEVKLYTDEGALLDTDHLEIPSTNFQITIPVLTQKELSLTYDIRSVPNGFDLNWFRKRLNLSQESITLASRTNTAFVDRDNFNIGIVALNAISLNYSEIFDIDLKEEFINQSNFEQVTLTLDNEGLASKEIFLTSDNVSIINAPSDYNCQAIMKGTPVIIVGEKEELDNLSSQDVVATVDLLGYNVRQSSTDKLDALISISPKLSDASEDTNLVRMWAVGNYRVDVYFTVKQEETVPETSSSIIEDESDSDE